MADIVTPSAFSPTAAPTVKPVTPTPVAPTAPAPAPAPKPDLEARVVEERRRAEVLLQRQKSALTAEAKKERESFGAKLTRLGELEKSHAQAKLNPEAFLKSIYGDDWYDRVVTAKLNSGVPTADVLADEIAKVEERVEAKWKAREEDSKRAAQAQQAQTVDGVRRQIQAEGAHFWSRAGKDYPALEGLGDASRISELLAERIELHYNSTRQVDSEGRLLRDGRVLTMSEAATSLENQILALTERAVGAPKYAERFRPKPVAPTPVAQQTRRTLSNDLTGSTPARSAPANDEEKRARAIAAFEAVARKPT